MDTYTGTHPQLWIDGYQGRGLQVSKIFDGYKSVTDWPASDFYQEITKEYPDAKVILTTRNPDSWWKSIKDTIHIHSPVVHTWGLFFLQAFVPRFRRFWYMIRHIATLHMEETEAKADFLRHSAQVKATIPAEKLLEFSMKDGWQPLCTFLGVPVPKVPFPKSNSREEATQKLTSLGKIGWIAMLSAIAATGISVGMAYIIGGRYFSGIIAAVGICIMSSCVMEAMRVSRFYGKKAS
ncbi:unnamed protein product [Ascophyllum nodosum]